MHTVKSLREQGYSIRVHHIRRYRTDPNDQSYGFPTPVKQILLARGGTTDVAITTPDGVNVRAIAVCSNKDGYNKKCGVMIALGRALKQLNSFDKQTFDPNNYTDKDHPVHV